MTVPHARTRQSARVLGFDFGMRSIGVAVASRVTGTASPCGVVRARDGMPDWDAIDRLLREWEPAELLVGLPLNMDGSHSELGAAADRFRRRLAARYHLPAHCMDERLTTRAAQELVPATGRAAADKARRDAAAACLILESWLREE